MNRERLPLPKKLENELGDIPRYKPKPFCVDDMLTSSVENTLFEDAFGPLVRKSERTSEWTSEWTSEGTRTSEGKAGDFTTLLASKLADTEKENKALRNRLAVSHMTITRLEGELREAKDVMKTQAAHGSVESLQAIQDIRHDNSCLQRQLMEMEQFLADYGLHWVGYDEQRQQEKEEREEHAGEEEMHNFDMFKKRVDELNSLITEEPAKVVTAAHGAGVKARFAHMSEIVESIKLTMYKNGLMIRRGPFRAAGSESFNSFTRDIMDGYFPSEFRESSPDGVMLELIDRRDTYFRDDKSTESSYRSEEMKGDQLLQRLPKTVIKGGDIVTVRGDIGSLLSSNDQAPSGEGKTNGDTGSSPSKIARGKQVLHLPTRAKEALESDQDTGDEVITSVQVKWHNGRDVFILKMFGSDTVNDIKEAIMVHVGGSDGKYEPPDFVLRCAYPPRDLPDHATLIEAKLVPSGTLHVKLL